MRNSEYVALAIAGWIGETMGRHQDFIFEGIEHLDVERFISSLSDIDGFRTVEFSIALAGFGVSLRKIRRICRDQGMDGLAALADDMFIAARWRNNRRRHRRIIALSSGYHAGVHTLSHFGRPSAGDLASVMLNFAKRRLNLPGADMGDPAANERHQQLLDALATDDMFGPLRSLNGCALFLSRWDTLRSVIRDAAPTTALTELGLLPDPHLFDGPADFQKRLKQNLDTTSAVKELRRSDLENRARIIPTYEDRDLRTRLEESFRVVRSWMFSGFSDPVPTLSQAIDVIKMPAKPKGTIRPIPDTELTIHEEFIDALLTNRLSDAKSISKAIDDAWNRFRDGESEEFGVHADLSGGRYLDSELSIDTDMLRWVGQFCSAEVWGGFFETSCPQIDDALRRVAETRPITITPSCIATIEGEKYSFCQLLEGWDMQAVSLGRTSAVSLVEMWSKLVDIRTSLIGDVGQLMLNCREWLHGHPARLPVIQEYLHLADELYGRVQQDFGAMSRLSPDWARATLEALLALDVLQIRLLPNEKHGQSTSTAILLPTHPLTIWRSQQFSVILQSLGRDDSVTHDERETIRNSVLAPEAFLTVLRLGSAPDGRGVNRILPLAGEFGGLPLFQNLSNTCSGPDGSERLCSAMDQYILLHPNHPYPLRVALVNPPQVGELLTLFVKMLNDRRYRGRQRLSAIAVSVFSTSRHRERVHDSFSSFGKTDDLIQEQIASGRIMVSVERIDSATERGWDELLACMCKRPSHIVAIFDESSIHIRRRELGMNLPMSPFCVRNDVKVDVLTGRIELRPQPGDSPFGQFLRLMNELDERQDDSTAYAHSDSGHLAKMVDQLLLGKRPAGRWLFLADRGLPNHSSMESVCVWQQREGQRDTLLVAPDLSSLVVALEPVVRSLGLSAPMFRLVHALELGSRLLGAALFSMIRRDCRPDRNAVIGFLGLVATAQDLIERFPGCLVCSLDHPMARSWLRAGNASLGGERCDLIALLETGNRLKVIAVEVKTSSDVLGYDHIRIKHADDQVAGSLDAIRDAISAVAGTACSPLAIPRCEMLKQAMVRSADLGARGSSHPKVDRLRWGKWLERLFSAEGARDVVFEGLIVRVLIRQERVIGDCEFQNIRWLIRTLTRLDISRLLGREDGDDDEVETGERSDGSVRGRASDRVDYQHSHDAVDSEARTLDRRDTDEPADSTSNADLVAGFDASNSSGEVEESAQHNWPPAVNRLGMIGQYEAVDRLVEQILFSQEMNRRFSDKLFVGPAGVGKSSLAKSIGDRLGKRVVFCNGSSLRRPRDLIDMIFSNSERRSGVSVGVPQCLVFIDEVHGISSSVATVLLSAMDDQRITTIDGITYDFENVVFLLATTDPGRLSEAFQSRPDKTWLRPYTLRELAGIVWLRGSSELDGVSLPESACIEIAARMRCNPRKAVRALVHQIIPHFFARMRAEGVSHVSWRDLGGRLTAESIGSFFDGQGIDRNGIDGPCRRFMIYLRERGAVSESNLRQALKIPQRNDFIEVLEYLERLGLVQTSSAGRILTELGVMYVDSDQKPDLRDIIALDDTGM